MNSKEFLLTYRIRSGVSDFEWFDTEEELLERVDFLGDIIEDVEAIELRVVKTIIGAN